MKLEITVRSSDSSLKYEFRDGKIVEGVTIERIGTKVIREITNEPFDITIDIVKTIVIPIVAPIIAAYLVHRLEKDKKAQLMINQKNVQVNAEEIKQLIINLSMEEKDKEK
jgi:hypothetical protein